MTTAQLLRSSRMFSRLCRHPVFSGAEYEADMRRKRAARLRDFRRFVPFAQRQEIIGLLRSLPYSVR